MLFSVGYKLDSVDRIESFVRNLSKVFCNPTGFEPYKPNERDHLFWALDAGNDWKITFFTGARADRFNITYRYQSERNKAEQALGEWLKFKFSATPLALSKIKINNVDTRASRLMRGDCHSLWWEITCPPGRFTITIGEEKEDSQLVASSEGRAGDIIYDSENFLRAEVALTLFFPTKPGYRIVEIDEYETLAALPKNDESVEIYTPSGWDIVPTLHLDYSQIYQTKRPLPIL